eukprot:9479421-Pyramimonas_sp.AAC.1
MGRLQPPWKRWRQVKQNPVRARFDSSSPADDDWNTNESSTNWRIRSACAATTSSSAHLSAKVPSAWRC